ncbi:MAG: GNAT family N-acetyltransferase [Bacteroidota bacterium]
MEMIPHTLLLQGKFISLRPLRSEEFRLFYKWATHSDATSYWYQSKPGDEIPSYMVFRHEWPSYYFLDDFPEKGRCFGIVLNEQLIGQVNYNEIQQADQSVSLDILLSNKNNMNKGYGSDALKTLTTYLFKTFPLKSCSAEIFGENTRAVQAFQKAGFQIQQEFERGGKSWVLLVMNSPLSI